jgi:hypothetical protein
MHYEKLENVVLLGHLLEDDKALLDDLNLLRVAHDLMLLHKRDLRGGNMACKIVWPAEVVKVVETGVASPVVERARVPPALIMAWSCE